MTDDDALPERFGRYALIEKIGRGGMGEVFSARVEGVHGFEKTVAIKRILPSLSQNPQFRAMLIDEAKIACLLAHPNIVQVLELGEVEGGLFLAMEYVDGRSLHELMRELDEVDQTLTAPEAAYIMIEVLQGLHAAHVQKDARGKPAHIIHRDVSPQNVLLSFTGLVKVIDFGIARAKDRLETTEHGNVKGKLSYMAPEQLDPDRIGAGDIDGRVDVFAAGVVLHEMLTGRALFRRDGQGATMMAILDDPIPDPGDEGVDRELADIVLRLLERDRDARPNASEAAAALRGWLYRHDAAFTPERLAQRMAQAFDDDEAPDTAPVAASDISTDALRPPAEESTDRSDVPDGSDATTLEQAEDRRPVRLVDEHTPGTPIGQFSGDVVPTRTLVVADAVSDATAATSHARPRPSSRVTVLRSEELRPPASPRRGRLAAVLAVSVVAGVAFAAGLIVWAESQTEPPATVDVETPPETRASEAEQAALAPADGDAERVILVVTTSPPGARVQRAGEDKTQAAPARFSVRPGDVVEVRASALHHDDVSERVRVPADEDAPSFHLELPPTPVPLRIDVTPRQATVTVNGAPLASDARVRPGEDLHIVAEHNGAQAEAHQRATVGRPLVVALTLPDAPPRSARDRKRSRTRGRSETKARAEAAPQPPRGKGTLVLTTSPNWAEVWIDGRRLKNATPVRERLSAGEHEVKLVNEPKGLSRRFSITIEPGDETKKHVKF